MWTLVVQEFNYDDVGRIIDTAIIKVLVFDNYEDANINLETVARNILTDKEMSEDQSVFTQLNKDSLSIKKISKQISRGYIYNSKHTGTLELFRINLVKIDVSSVNRLRYPTKDCSKYNIVVDQIKAMNALRAEDQSAQIYN